MKDVEQVTPTDEINKESVPQKKLTKELEINEASWKLGRTISPLSRKGSVGRFFLGRMMHSKRYNNSDKLAAAVSSSASAADPEPPKRPPRTPRRKTLANLNGESPYRQEEHENQINANQERSATLTSQRKGSVGRFLGRVLSSKAFSASEGMCFLIPHQHQIVYFFGLFFVNKLLVIKVIITKLLY